MEKSPETIKKMFDSIAEKYDFNNNLISFGTHKFIKRLCAEKLELCCSEKILDLCTGTGDVAGFIKQKYPSAEVIGADFSQKMLEIAAKKHPDVKFINADCTNLSFENEYFDAVIMSFGLRNIENYEKALDEANRVLKKGGIFMHIDFGKKNPLQDVLFDFLIPKLVKLFYKNDVPYEYLIESKKMFFKPKKLIELFQNHGFTFKEKHDFLFGAISCQIMQKT